MLRRNFMKLLGGLPFVGAAVKAEEPKPKLKVASGQELILEERSEWKWAVVELTATYPGNLKDSVHRLCRYDDRMVFAREIEVIATGTAPTDAFTWNFFLSNDSVFGKKWLMVEILGPADYVRVRVPYKKHKQWKSITCWRNES